MTRSFKQPPGEEQCLPARLAFLNTPEPLPKHSTSRSRLGPPPSVNTQEHNTPETCPQVLLPRCVKLAAKIISILPRVPQLVSRTTIYPVLKVQNAGLLRDPLPQS